MLPKTLYVSLPYLYIAIGVFCGVVLESDIVLLFSIILMLMGFLVLWMRHNSQGYSKAESVSITHQIKSRSWNDVFQAEQERRLIGLIREFPLIDNSGNLIPFDRRVISGRDSEAA